MASGDRAEIHYTINDGQSIMRELSFNIGAEKECGLLVVVCP
jgi:hypothetical protein